VSLLKPILDAAAQVVRGGVVAFPTETFYGLAVDALDLRALSRLFAFKVREGGKASALLVQDVSMFAELSSDFSAKARELANAHWPGPLTIAVPARPDLPEALVADGFIAARVSPHPVAHALVTLVGRPITATSANPSGLPPVCTAQEVAAYFKGKAFHLLDGGNSPGGAPSTLVRVRGESVEILRQGAVFL
jgi:L-threonylcarbamoyladenylate synthase